jgi:Spx/MgsR family transcriptional regulator
MTTLYGISNCDTIKKAKKWLETNGIEYRFHDYKKQSVERTFLKNMIDEHGVDKIVNKRGTTYRALSASQKDALTEDTAVAMLVDNTSMIKRPILTMNDRSYIGFNANQYAEIFKLA